MARAVVAAECVEPSTVTRSPATASAAGFAASASRFSICVPVGFSPGLPCRRPVLPPLPLALPDGLGVGGQGEDHATPASARELGSEGTGLESEGDEAIELRITEVPPAAPVILVAGTSQVSIPLLGGILIPAPEQIFTPQLADATGSLTMGFDWPAGVAPGVPTYWQGWVVDASGAQGFTSTNAALAWTE